MVSPICSEQVLLPVTLLSVFEKPSSIRIVLDFRIEGKGLWTVQLNPEDSHGNWVAPGKISCYHILSIQCPVHGWLKLLFAECLSACSPWGLHRPQIYTLSCPVCCFLLFAYQLPQYFSFLVF